MKQGKCRFYNCEKVSQHGFQLVGDPSLTEMSKQKRTYDDFSLIYPNLKCRLTRPEQFTVLGVDHFSRDFCDKIESPVGKIDSLCSAGDAIFSALRTLNGEDILDPNVNRGTLDLEDELKDHFLYKDVYNSILDYNAIYKKKVSREVKGLLQNSTEAPREVTMQGGSGDDPILKAKLGENGDILIPLPQSAANPENPHQKAHAVLPENSRSILLSAPTKQQQDQQASRIVWQPMEQAKQDVVYEFQVLMGRIVDPL